MPRLSTTVARSIVFMVFVLPHCVTGVARQCGVEDASGTMGPASPDHETGFMERLGGSYAAGTQCGARADDVSTNSQASYGSGTAARGSETPGLLAARRLNPANCTRRSVFICFLAGWRG